MKELESSKSMNTFICVSRIKQGGNIGNKRSDLIKQCAKEAIQADNEFVDPDLIYTNLTF